MIGLEPTTQAWKLVFYLSTRLEKRDTFKMEGEEGLEPSTNGVKFHCSNQLNYSPILNSN